MLKKKGVLVQSHKSLGSFSAICHFLKFENFKKISVHFRVHTHNGMTF
jgi:hypothetical protein